MKPDIRTIHPVDGRKIRFPTAKGVGRVLREPTSVTWSNYWHRKLRDGDISLEAVPPTQSAPAQAADRSLPAVAAPALAPKAKEA